MKKRANELNFAGRIEAADINRQAATDNRATQADVNGCDRLFSAIWIAALEEMKPKY